MALGEPSNFFRSIVGFYLKRLDPQKNRPILGFPNQGGGGFSLIPIYFVKLAKTKFAFVNGQKCDETHNTYRIN